MLTTTLEMLHQHGACRDRYRYLCKALGGARAYGRKKPITLLRILETNGLEDTLWALRAVPLSQVRERDDVVKEFAIRCLLSAPTIPGDQKLTRTDALQHVMAMKTYLGGDGECRLGVIMANTAKRLEGIARMMWIQDYQMATWVAVGHQEVKQKHEAILRELLEEGAGDGESV